MQLTGNFKNENPYKVLLFMACVLVGLRIIFIGVMGPMPQDAYYHFYSEHPALSYFDHPPAIAYILGLFTTLFGDHVFVIKLADSFVSMLTLFFFYRLSCCFYDRQQAIKATLLFLSSLMLTILSLVSTPDTPLLLFWVLSLLAIYKAIFQDKKIYWILAGLAMGLAFDSKYSAVFLPFGMLLFLVLSAAHRKSLKTVWPWLCCLTFFIVSTPVLIWNIEHNFASFRFQGTERIHSAFAFQLRPKYLLGLIGHQSALLIPILFGALFYGIFSLLKRYKGKWGQLPDEKKFLLCFFLPVFLTFLCLSCIYWVKINWMMPAYVSGIIWISSYFNLKWLKWQMLFAVVVHLGLAVEILFYPFPVQSDDTWMGWEVLAKQVQKVQKQSEADFVFSADGYKTSAELNLYSDDFVYAQNVIGENALQFDYIGTDLKKLDGKDALFIDSEPRFTDTLKQGDIPDELLGYFSSVHELSPILIFDQNRPVRKFLVYLCKNYKVR